MLDSLLSRTSASATLRFIERKVGGGTRIASGADLIRTMNGWTAYLTSLGVAPGAPVLLPMRSSVDAIALLLACWQAGLLPIPLKSSAPVAYVEDILERVQPAVVFSDSASARLLGVRGRVAPGTPNARYTPILLERSISSRSVWPEGGEIGILTTGSTGEPKVVINTLGRVLDNASMHARELGLEKADRIGLSLPLSFSYGLVAGLLATCMVEATGILIDPEGDDVGAALLEQAATVAMATPYGARQIFTRGALPTLRVLSVGGDVLHAPLASELLDNGPALTLYATYGLSEAGPRVATCHVTRALLDEFGAVPLGRPLSGVELALSRATSSSSPSELLVRSPTRMLGYLDERAATREVLDDVTGELMTGDQFSMRSGQLFFAGRTRRVICRAGEKLYPAVIERQIIAAGCVLDAVVRSMPHPEYGEVPEAYVIPGQGFSLPEMKRALRRRLPSSQIPLAWKVVEYMPPGMRK